MPPRNNRNFKKANWEQYTSVLESSFTSFPGENYRSFADLIYEAAQLSIPLYKSNVNKQYHIPWWDQSCAEVIKDRIKATKQFQLTPNLQNYLIVKNKCAIARRFLKEKRKNNFRKFAEGLNRNSSIKTIWDKVRKIAGYGNSPINSLPDPNMAQEILNCLAPPSIHLHQQSIQTSNTSSPFTFNEYKFIINSKKESATGLDLISYSMIRNLPHSGSLLLLQIFNKCLSTRTIPIEWKQSLIISILKPIKDKLTATNYRPIARTSCVGKVLESMIKNRLEWLIENKGIVRPLQLGFRRGKGCLQCISFLTSEIQKSINNNECKIRIFLDIHSAYDNVSIDKLYSTLIHLDIPHDVANLIHDFLKCRELFVKDNSGWLNGHNGKYGIWCFSPDINYSFSSKLPKHTQICTAEVTAINHAVQIIREQNITDAIIFSDSNSALQKIKKTGFFKDTEHKSYLTKRGIILARNNNIKILLAWISGHTGITGNYKADQLANIGRSLNIPMNIKLKFSNFTPYLKRGIWSNWAAEWYEGYGTSNSFYANINKRIHTLPWFNKFAYISRRHLTTIIRMRTAHCSSPLHLFRIGVKDDPYCECGQVGGLNHILLECRLNQNPHFDLYAELAKIKLTY
ncbi:uncharacterized protein [Diabrotica undecimpunctata]|uniref:uncharacterized protein n=1 Tax=Diabrotica undecimpunctata TaxID=50387 RepID=UPI003B63D8FD